MTAPPPTILARPPYAKRDVLAEYARGWWQTELGNIQRAIPTFPTRAIAGGSYTPTANDYALMVNTTTGNATITLPDPRRVQGLTLIIKKTDASANHVLIVGTVDGVVNPTLSAQYATFTVMSDGTAWRLISRI